MNEKPIIFYHAHCPDGFGGAYAAWKKLGENAEYIPLSRSDDPPFEIASQREVFFIDFCYELPIMEKFKALAKRLVVIDHHEGVEDAIKSAPEFLYDEKRSGAGLAWDYFHPNMERPTLINHLEDDDLFRFSIQNTREIMTYLLTKPLDFLVWDEFAHSLDDEEKKEAILFKARAYKEYLDVLAEMSVAHAKLVSFEGYICLFAHTHSLKTMRSLVGNMLAKKLPPIGLVVSAHPNGYGVSIRGDGSVDVAKIAQKFGGNGHPNSAGFLIPREGPFPWTLIKEDENSRD